jgi:hypothetical protein
LYSALYRIKALKPLLSRVKALKRFLTKKSIGQITQKTPKNVEKICTILPIDKKVNLCYNQGTKKRKRERE